MTGVTENYPVRIWRGVQRRKMPLHSEPLPRAVFESQKKPAESHSALLHERVGALADFLQRHFEATKLLRAQFREHSLHLPGMLSEGWNNEVLAARGEGDHPNAPVLGALDPADQALCDEAVHGDTN